MVQDVGNFADKVITSRGDIVRGSSSGTRERLALGSNNTFLKSDGSDCAWGAGASGNVEILGQTDLSSAGSEIEVLVTQSNIPDDYAFFRVIGGGDTTGSCNLNFTIKSAGSYITEYHQNAVQVKLGVGSDIYLGSDSVLELQSTAEINVSRPVAWIIDIAGANSGHPASTIWTWNMTGITGCMNLDHRSFSCGTVGTGVSGLEFDGCKAELDNSKNFEEEAYMTVLGFKSA